MLKRKIYQELVNWKKESNGKTALLIEGARRVGKSTITREFGANEYKSYIVIDFSMKNKRIISLFEEGFDDKDLFFAELSAVVNTTFYIRNTLIIFDEVQKYPHARELIKHFVEDGRYDYIETGSLISIKKNIKDITIPSEEQKITLHPFDFEEFMWALYDNGEQQFNFIRECYTKQKRVGVNHDKFMKDFRIYMIVGGMPQAVNEYISSKDFRKVDSIKQNIISLYKDDMRKLPKISSEKVLDIYNQIPSQLSNPNKKFNITSMGKNAKTRNFDTTFTWLEEAKLINQFFATSVPNIAFAFTLDYNKRKVFINDTGLLVTLALGQKIIMEDEIYNKLLFDKLHINEGMIAENVVAQQIASSNHEQIFYYNLDKEENLRPVEIDFLLRIGSKLSPLETKSSAYTEHSSLDKIRKKFSIHIGKSYIIYDRDYMVKDEIIHLPIYMVGLL
ncbi:MAG: AAA family ATPase [Acholeplasmatales bacterium]|jgi:predicted AAA+ superfamily ATPase|nr:AAA family ATPase [Acholeplasmatales bacterium]